MIKTLPWVAWGGLWADLCRTGTSAGCPSGRGSQSTAESQRRHRRKTESEFLNKSLSTTITSNCKINCCCIVLLTKQTLVIWSASGLTLGVTLSSILTCSRTSSGILFNSAGLIVLSYDTEEQTQTWAGNFRLEMDHKLFNRCDFIFKSR